MIRCVRLWTGEDGDSLLEEGWIDLSSGVRGGTLEYQTKSGATFTIRPGDVLLAQDNSGTGHKWKLIGDEPWRRAYVVYDQGADLHYQPANTEEQL
jgi:hypothetical protein